MSRFKIGDVLVLRAQTTSGPLTWTTAGHGMQPGDACVVVDFDHEGDIVVTFARTGPDLDGWCDDWFDLVEDGNET